jgi:phage-related protein (TIGR01555 family)
MAKRKTVNFDSGFLGFAGHRDSSSSSLMSGHYFLDQRVLQAAYIHNGFARTICDVPAEEMTRAGFTIEGDSITEDDKNAIQSRLEELDAVKHLNEALKWRRAFGGSLILLGVDDGQRDITQPVNEERIKGVEFMRVYDCFEARPDKYYDVESPKFGLVELWAISPKLGGTTFKVHESRVLVFDGESVPNDIRQANSGWGASVIQGAFVQLNRLDNSYNYANLLLERMQQAVHGIPGLAQMLGEPGAEDLVARRVNIVDRVRGAANTIVIDGEETYEVKSMSLSGVQEIVDRNAEALSAVTRIPVFVLMTRSPGGLNATGASNQDAWFAQVESWQNDQLRKPVDRLVSLLRRADSEGNTDGGDYTLEFNPLSSPGDKDQAEIDLKKEQIKKTQMETLTGFANAGVMDQDEIRDLVREEYELVGDAPEPEEEVPAPMVLNPGQKVVDPTPGQSNPAPVGKK